MFVAAALPDETVAAVWESLAPVRDDFRGTRWMPPETLHLTLVFLGATDPARAAAIADAMAPVTARHAAYRTSVIGAGGRVDDRSRSRSGGVSMSRVAAKRLEAPLASGSCDGDAPKTSTRSGGRGEWSSSSLPGRTFGTPVSCS